MKNKETTKKYEFDIINYSRDYEFDINNYNRDEVDSLLDTLDEDHQHNLIFRDENNKIVKRFYYDVHEEKIVTYENIGGVEYVNEFTNDDF